MGNIHLIQIVFIVLTLLFIIFCYFHRDSILYKIGNFNLFETKRKKKRKQTKDKKPIKRKVTSSFFTGSKYQRRRGKHIKPHQD
ncbi:MAG: putative membrane protein [Flavobacteriaceae bacterium]|jgi:uncharacterized membrane protein